MNKLKLVLRDPLPVFKKLGSMEGVSIEIAGKYPSSQPELAAEIGNADYVISDIADYTNKEVFEKCGNLKYLGLTASDFSCVDLELAKKHGVFVSNAHGYAAGAVAEFVFCQLLSFYRANSKFNARDWIRDPAEGEELGGKTVGIIGFGAIGKRIAELARAFGMRTLYWSRNKGGGAAEYSGLDSLLSHSDIVVVALPGSEETKNLLDAKMISLLKTSAVVVNVARGSIVDEKALAEALAQKKIRGAIVDVFAEEPPPKGHPFLNMENVLASPHIAWNTKEARQRLADVVVENFIQFIGKSANHKY